MIKKIEIQIAQQHLDKLKEKIRNTRWPDEIEGSGWNYGASLYYMKELADFWLNVYDWRKTESEINSYPNYIATIDGFKIHFQHIKGTGQKNIPLIMTHGWPSSFLEMKKLIPLLTQSSPLAFDLVIPSMMGYGFSQKIRESGCNVIFMAELWHKLMTELGYDKYGVQGGDFGAGISTALAAKYPEHVTGIHLNYIPGNYVPKMEENEEFTKEENDYLDQEEAWYAKEGGYSLQQNTKPLTLAYGLNDSPVGLAAWIVEKMHGWADCNGYIGNVFTKDELLSNITLYWITETIHSSIRLYNENNKVPLILGKETFINTPTAIAHFKYEEPFPPRSFIERGYNIKQWSDFPSGGHFPAIEKPELLAEDIIKFFSLHT
ncbi:MAG: epoxide hydrolase [Bacteroidales bacterium]|nr:epoxide hydrolase [Bacteroidales bacterium]